MYYKLTKSKKSYIDVRTMYKEFHLLPNSFDYYKQTFLKSKKKAKIIKFSWLFWCFEINFIHC